jgi:putative transposase
VPQQPRLDGQRQALLPLVQMRQQHLEPCSELPTDPLWYAHAAHTTPTTHKNQKRHLDSLRLHRARNLLAKVPAHAQATIKAEYWAIFDNSDVPPGEAAVAEVTRRAAAFASKWRKLYPSAVACLEDDFEHLVTYLRFPTEHQGRIRHSNFIERTFGETRRRVKVIGRLPGERSCLSLVWAVLDRASRGWRGVQQTLGSIRLLAELRRELFDQAPTREEVVAETAVTPAA